MKKLLYIIPGFNIGGAQKMVLNYLDNIDRNKFVVKTVSIHKNNNTEFDQIILNKEFDVVYLNRKHKFDLSIIGKIKKVIKEFNPDIVHTHLNVLKYMNKIVKKNKNIDFYHTIHSVPHKDTRGFFRKYLNKRVLKRENVTPIALTEKQAKMTDKYYNINKTIILNNSIDAKPFEEAKAISKEFKGNFVIGHIGSFKDAKNHDFIFKIFEESYKRDKTAILLLAGTGELLSYYKEKIKYCEYKESVHFLGLRNDIPQLLKKFDVFLFPSKYEGFPLVMLEAQYSGLKCVVSEAITDEVFIRSNVIVHSLKEDVHVWVDSIFCSNHSDKKLPKYNDLKIENNILELQKLYLNGK